GSAATFFLDGFSGRLIECSRPDCHTLSAVFFIVSIHFPITTDLSILVISFEDAYSSLCFISSQALSPMPCVFTSANSPCSFSPWSFILSEPERNCLSRCFSC